MRVRDIKNGRFSDNGTVPDDPLRAKLDELSLRLVDQMLAGTEPLGGDEVALYKAVSNYYTATRRLPTAKPDDDSDAGFLAMKERLNAGSDPTSPDC